MRNVLGALAACLLLTGCAGGGAATEEATAVASAFETAVQEQDLARACGLLSPEARTALEDCEQGLEESDLPGVTGTPTAQVYGQNGIVRWRGETVFVSRFPGGWKVIAAGCTPREERPYDCSVSGG